MAQQKRGRADDVLRANVRLLRLGGAWPPRARRGLRRLFPLYTASIYFCQSATIAMGALLTYDLWGDVDAIMLTYVNTFTLLGGFIKLAYFSSDVPGYRALVAALRGLAREQWPHCQADARLMAVFGAAQRKALWLTFGPLAYLNVLGPTWFFMPLIVRATTGSQERLLPFVNMRDSVTAIFPLYVAIYVVQVYCMFFWNIISVGLDMFFVSCMIHVAAQLRILNERLANLGGAPADEAYRSVPSHKIIRGFGAAQKTFSRDGRMGDMYEELRNCIKTHQHILRQLTEDTPAHDESCGHDAVHVQCIGGMHHPVPGDVQSRGKLDSEMFNVPSNASVSNLYLLLGRTRNSLSGGAAVPVRLPQRVGGREPACQCAAAHPHVQRTEAAAAHRRQVLPRQPRHLRHADKCLIYILHPDASDEGPRINCADIDGLPFHASSIKHSHQNIISLEL